MFDKLFSRIGGIFGTTSDKQTTEMDTLEAASVADSSARNQNISALSQLDEVAIMVEEQQIDPALLLKPMRRYGRICDCPKDPNFSMFCTKARNWYENTNTGSQSLEMDTSKKYSKMKTAYKNLALMTPDEDSLA